MKQIDVDKLIESLGPDGAIAGLEQSNLTIPELFELLTRYGISVEKKTKRRDIINELVNRNVTRIEKTAPELRSMNYADLSKYFVGRRVSRTELLNLLTQFNIRPGSKARENLAEFAAREISEVGMFERIAKGKRNQ